MIILLYVACIGFGVLNLLSYRRNRREMHLFVAALDFLAVILKVAV